MNMDPLSEVRPILFETYGILYLGVAISCVLYGITCIQMFKYFRSQRKDRWLIPVLVVVLMALDTVHQAVVVHMPYYYLITHYADPLALANNIADSAILRLDLAFIYGLSNLYLLWRLWTLSGNRWFAGFCLIGILTQFGLNLELSVDSFVNSQTVQAHVSLFGLKDVIAGLAVDVLLDLMLALGLVYYLQRSKNGWRKSNTLVNKLIVITMATGLLPTIFVIGTLISIIVAPGALYDLFFESMLGKLYINTILTSLNTRQYLNTQLNSGTNYLDTHSNVLPLEFRGSGRSSKEIGSGRLDLNTIGETASVQVESGSAGSHGETYKSANLGENKQV